MVRMMAGLLMRFNRVDARSCASFGRLASGGIWKIGAILIPMKNIGFFGLGLLGRQVSLVDQAPHNLAHTVEPPVFAGRRAAAPKSVAIPGRRFEHRQKDSFLGAEIGGFLVEIIARCRANSRSEEHTSELQSRPH